MRFYQPHTQFFCGIDLHGKTMYICLIDQNGTIHRHTNLPNHNKTLLKVIRDFKQDLVIGVESTSNWYWLADLCAQQDIEFVLGHALYMKAIHGGKTKNDKIDSEKIAKLLAGGLFPTAYTYPKEKRALRDLLRRRLRYVRQRAELFTHIQLLNRQANLKPLGRSAQFTTQRKALLQRFDDPSVRLSVEADLDMIEHYDKIIQSLERHILEQAKGHYAKELVLLRSIPGVGPIISLTILFEIDTIERFTTRQQFASYCRLVRPRHESAGKQYAAKGSKIGNPYLKWAFSEAAIHAARLSPRVDSQLQKLASRHGQGKAYSLLAHKLGRAVYYMLNQEKIFDEEKFLRV